MERLQTQADLAAAVARLTAVEPRFQALVDRHGLPALRRADPGLASLLRIVTDQLISLKAGEAIWRRLEARFGGFSATDVLAASEDDLRGLGLSGAKARTFRAAARAFTDAPFAAVAAQGVQEMEARLLAIPGVGPWTASIYLLTAFQVADAWPAADLALQVAAGDLLCGGERPSARLMVALAVPWRPNRTAAALLLWRHYRAMRGLPPG